MHKNWLFSIKMAISLGSLKFLEKITIVFFAHYLPRYANNVTIFVKLSGMKHPYVHHWFQLSFIHLTYVLLI